MNFQADAFEHCSACVAARSWLGNDLAAPGATPLRSWQTGCMSCNALRLLDEALQLPDKERAELALRLLDSVGEPADQIERAWIEEAKRRLAEIDRGEVRTVPWPEARQRIFAR
jgi:putative addiction module component (TIGR02574 family)